MLSPYTSFLTNIHPTCNPHWGLWYLGNFSVMSNFFNLSYIVCGADRIEGENPQLHFPVAEESLSWEQQEWKAVLICRAFGQLPLAGAATFPRRSAPSIPPLKAVQDIGGAPSSGVLCMDLHTTASSRADKTHPDLLAPQESCVAKSSHHTLRAETRLPWEAVC